MQSFKFVGADNIYKEEPIDIIESSRLVGGMTGLFKGYQKIYGLDFQFR